MAVIGWRELARNGTHLLGGSPEFERRFVATLDNPDTNAGDIVGAIQCWHGSPHPEIAEAKCYDLTYNEQYEGNRFWTEIVAKYKFLTEGQDPTLLPWQRPDIWKFQTQGVAVPALFYYDDDTQKPMTNSAGDWIEGITADEAQQKVTIQSNRQAFPSALAAAVTNCVNDGTYLGFATDCVKVQGISGEQAVEKVTIGGVEQEVSYWKITSELLCRQTGWNLLIPDVGYNYIDGGTRKRAKVIGPSGEEIASSNPVPLNGSGGQAGGGSMPAILTRRVYGRITMSTYFGTPPT